MEIGRKNKDKSLRLMDGALMIKRIYEKDGITHIEAFQPKVIRTFIQRMTIAKTGATIFNGESQG